MCACVCVEGDAADMEKGMPSLLCHRAQRGSAHTQSTYLSSWVKHKHFCILFQGSLLSPNLCSDVVTQRARTHIQCHDGKSRTTRTHSFTRNNSLTLSV